MTTLGPKSGALEPIAGLGGVILPSERNARVRASVGLRGPPLPTISDADWAAGWAEYDRLTERRREVAAAVREGLRRTCAILNRDKDRSARLTPLEYERWIDEGDYYPASWAKHALDAWREAHPTPIILPRDAYDDLAPEQRAPYAPDDA